MELSDLKTMLQIKDNKRDDILNLIIKNTTQALAFKLGLKAGVSIPDVLDYIALEVSVKRYNRLANEGMSSYTQEGQSITFSANDFDEFANDIDAWKDENGVKDNNSGRFLFI
ncbi:phage head-tail connector protein [Leuconostoc gasicomitatum]|uniref:phage head-tail connector protein n=1 Tax=Leuconostoc gasicomitatum TaxID=115778 RepID=UPI001CC3ED1B|nr:phage head-tail connector protein [Leuconostoc gasicomitatum]MBZ5949261.1 phage head-tail connector protein [Leuconostoc gasicomitatum]